MRILQLTKWVSARADNGGKLRSYGLGLALSRFAELDVVGLRDDNRGAALGEAPRLRHYRNRVAVEMEGGVRRAVLVSSGLVRGQGLRSIRFASAVLRRRVAEMMARAAYDLVQVEELSMLANLPPRAGALPLVYSAHNVESALAPQLFRARGRAWHRLTGLERRRTEAEERRALGRAQFCLAVSEEDRRALAQLNPSATGRIHVVPNCVFDDVVPGPPRLRASGEAPEIVSVGRLGWPPNAQGARWFTAEVWPLLRRERECVVRFVGSGVPPGLAAELTAAGCAVSGDVDEVLPYLHRARAVFVPLRAGGGTRLKIVEAWAAGVPVVSTPVGAEGLGAIDGADVLLANDAQHFRDALCRVLEDDALYARLRDNGLRRAATLRWSSQAALLEPLYRAATAP